MGYLDELSEYITKADYLLKNLLYALSPLYKKEHGVGQDVVVPLFTTLHSTSESILILLLNQAVFDADVLLRTVMEGTIKYCYLMTGSPEERYEKYIEYKVKLPDIDKLSDHHKAVETVKILKEYSTNSTKPFEISILDEDEVEQLQKTYSKKERNELKQKWSYQALLRNLALSYPEYEAQLSTLSTYSLTSHFCHFDWTGVSSRQAQITDCGSDQSEIFDIGHSLRIIANVLSMEIFRVVEYMRGNQYQSQRATELSLQALNLAKVLGERNNAIIENQTKPNK